MTRTLYVPRRRRIKLVSFSSYDGEVLNLHNNFLAETSHLEAALREENICSASELNVNIAIDVITLTGIDRKHSSFPHLLNL